MQALYGSEQGRWKWFGDGERASSRNRRRWRRRRSGVLSIRPFNRFLHLLPLYLRCRKRKRSSCAGRWQRERMPPCSYSYASTCGGGGAWCFRKYKRELRLWLFRCLRLSHRRRGAVCGFVIRGHQLCVPVRVSSVFHAD